MLECAFKCSEDLIMAQIDKKLEKLTRAVDNMVLNNDFSDQELAAADEFRRFLARGERTYTSKDSIEQPIAFYFPVNPMSNQRMMVSNTQPIRMTSKGFRQSGDSRQRQRPRNVREPDPPPPSSAILESTDGQGATAEPRGVVRSVTFALRETAM